MRTETKDPITKGGTRLRRHQQNKQASELSDADALFLGTGVRAIARKTIPPGYTIADLKQFLTLLYGMYDEREAKEARIYDPFAQERGRRVTVARLAEALQAIVDRNTQQSA